MCRQGVLNENFSFLHHLKNDDDKDADKIGLQVHFDEQEWKYRKGQKRDVPDSPNLSLALNIEGLGVKCCGNW